jgi:RND family efflux transporter MFP subunit
MKRSSLFPVLAATVVLVMSPVAYAVTGPTVAVAKPAFREVTLTGFTRARATLPLAAETSGRVLEVSADIGGTIGEDGLFARLDATFIALDLEANQVEQTQLRSRIDYDQREVRRYRDLADRGNASRSRLDALEQTLKDNRHRLNALKIQAQILKERLARTRIQAPAGWGITARHIEPGQYVTPGDVLGEAADFSTLRVPFALTPEQLAALQRGPPAWSLSLPDFDLEMPAKIYCVNPGFDEQTRKIAIELELTGRPPEYRGGLRTRLTLRLPERTGAVMLPATAVDESYEEHWVTREDGQRFRVVLLGRGADADLWRVASPQIKAGERFLLNAEE